MPAPPLVHTSLSNPYTRRTFLINLTAIARREMSILSSSMIWCDSSLSSPSLSNFSSKPKPRTPIRATASSCVQVLDLPWSSSRSLCFLRLSLRSFGFFSRASALESLLTRLSFWDPILPNSQLVHHHHSALSLPLHHTFINIRRSHCMTGSVHVICGI